MAFSSLSRQGAQVADATPAPAPAFCLIWCVIPLNVAKTLKFDKAARPRENRRCYAKPRNVEKYDDSRARHGSAEESEEAFDAPRPDGRRVTLARASRRKTQKPPRSLAGGAFFLPCGGPKKRRITIRRVCAPNGIRTRVSALRGPRPRPLDDRGVPSTAVILAGVADAVKGREPHPPRSGLPLGGMRFYNVQEFMRREYHHV